MATLWQRSFASAWANRLWYTSDMEWAYVLVIILSIFLALFLLLGIVLVILLIRVTMQIKSVTESAQRTAGNIEGLVENVSRFSGPGFLARSLIKQMRKIKKRKG